MFLQFLKTKQFQLLYWRVHIGTNWGKYPVLRIASLIYILNLIRDLVKSVDRRRELVSGNSGFKFRVEDDLAGAEMTFSDSRLEIKYLILANSNCRQRPRQSATILV